jgi:hypothetical protein
VAQLVEHHLAKVRVAGSNPVVRSNVPPGQGHKFVAQDQFRAPSPILYVTSIVPASESVDLGGTSNFRAKRHDVRPGSLSPAPVRSDVA